MTTSQERFAELVNRAEADIVLDEAALLIAAQAHPGLDIPAQLARLDDLAAGCPEPNLDGLLKHLFDDQGFTGNVVRYSDPRNSFLSDVLDRRVGIPISLAVLTMEVGRRIGLTLEGVGMPGHFLVRHVGEPPVLIDAFNGGRTLEEAEVGALFRRLHGDAAILSPELLAPARPRAILVRMLTNLRHLYEQSGDQPSIGWVNRLRAAIPAGHIQEMADLARAQAALARFDEAAFTLDALADSVPSPQDDLVRAEAKLLRSQLN